MIETTFVDYNDVAYAGALQNQLYRFGMSLTRLNDFMLAAKPILYGVVAPGNSVEESGAGISCLAEDTEVLSQAIHTIRSLSPSELAAMGKRGREWVIKDRDYRVLAGQFLEAVMKRDSTQINLVLRITQENKTLKMSYIHVMP